MKIQLFLVLIMAFITSCSRVKTISLKEHSFNSTPNKLVVLQVPGLSEEHLAYLRYLNSDLTREIWPEKFSCFGKTWRFNLYEVRPKGQDSLLSQITGVVSSKNSCEKYSTPAIWDRLSTLGYDSYFIQRGGAEFAESALKCNEKFFENSRVYISSPKGTKLKGDEFHFQRAKEYKKGSIYLDKTCSKGNCYSTPFEVFDHLWSEGKNKKVFVIQDYSIEKALKTKDRKVFLKALKDLASLIERIDNKVSSQLEDSLLVVTSSSPKNIRWPKKSLDWNKYQVMSGNNLLSPIWAKGAMSENFCGMYPEYEVFNRFFWRPKKSEIPFLDALK